MTLSPHGRWKDAIFRANPEVRYLVEIYDGTNTWQAVDGSITHPYSDLLACPVGIQKVDVVAPKLNPFTRHIELGEISIECTEEWLRPILIATRLKGKRLQVKIGASNLHETYFTNYVTKAQIDQIIPQHVDGKLVFTIVALGQLQILARTRIEGEWGAHHPLEALYDGVGGGILELGGGLSFDADSFDPSEAEYTDISHVILSRADAYRPGISYDLTDIQIPGISSSASASGTSEASQIDWGGIDGSVQALDLVEPLCRLMNGHLVEDEDGDLKFVRFDSTASTVDDWDEDDIIPGSFKQSPLGEHVINQILCDFARDPDGKFQHVFTGNDTGSQSAYAYPGESERIFPQKFSTCWLDSPMNLEANISNVATSLVLVRGNVRALSGNRSDAFAAISSNRPIYLMLDSSHIPNIANIEIVKATSLTRDTSVECSVLLGDGSTLGPFCGRCSLSSVSRAQLGTTASAHYKGYPDETRVYDITILVLLIEELLKRFAYDCPIIELATRGLLKYPYQLGELVTVTYPRFCAYDMDGIDDTLKWEIVGKQVHKDRIEWTLAYAGIESITYTGDGKTRRPPSLEQIEALGKATTATPHIVTGLEITQTAGLAGKVAYGIASNGMREVQIREDVSYTFTASKDTYVYVAMADGPYGTIVFHAVANGAARPSAPPSHLYIGKVVTGAAAITSIVQTRLNLSSLGTRHIMPGPTTPLNSGFSFWTRG